MILDDLPPQLRATVLVIDVWVTARRLGLVLEAKVGHGKLDDTLANGTRYPQDHRGYREQKGPAGTEGAG